MDDEFRDASKWAVPWGVIIVCVLMLFVFGLALFIIWGHQS